MATIPVTSLAVGHEALLRALEKWCECEFNKHDELVRICPSHESLGHALFVVHMEFGKHLADSDRLRREEGLLPAEEPLPHMLSEYAYQVLKAADR